jgi:hypothetical protein
MGSFCPSWAFYCPSWRLKPHEVVWQGIGCLAGVWPLQGSNSFDSVGVHSIRAMGRAEVSGPDAASFYKWLILPTPLRIGWGW